MQCVILAGGLATRMRPLTETKPKIMLPVAGVPFIDFQLAHLSRTGVTRATLCLGFLADQVQAYAGNGSRWGLQVDYVIEPETLRGTGGALSYALELGYLEERFLVTYGDSFLKVSFAEVYAAFLQSKQPALMSVFENRGQWDKSNVWVEGQTIRLYDKSKNLANEVQSKMHFIDFGLMGFERSLIASVPAHPSKWDLAELLTRLSQSGQLAAWKSPVRFYEIGSPSGLAELSLLFKRSENPENPS